VSVHHSPRVSFSKELSEIYLRKGEIFTVNVENTGDYGSHYHHIEVWLTPDGKPVVFLPDSVEIKNYDDWSKEYKKHFK
jgi:hypothetical protein